MTIANSEDCILVDTAEAAAEWLDEISGSEPVAFDLEADGLFSYEDKICLAQVACNTRCAIIDPIAAPAALEPLAAMLADPNIEKVAHGADYDVRLLKKDLGVGPVNLFDTMIAAQMLGYERLGLASLMEEHFGLELDKKYQRADWSKRPLSPEMLAYAAADVTHLVELSRILKGQLAEKGRAAWAAEEFKLLEGVEPPAQKGPWCLDVKGAYKLAPFALAVLQNLLEVRDAEAKRRNRPAFKVLSNKTLLEWAASPPRSRSDVVKTRGANRHMLERLAQPVLDAINIAKGTPSEEWPQKPAGTGRPPLTEAENARLKNLKETRKEVSEKLGIDPGILVNTATLERLARIEEGADADRVADELKNWQREAVGDELTGALA